MALKTINTKQEGDRGYIAGLNGSRVGLYAKGLYEAKQAAVAHFKPSKKNAGLLWVELAEDDQGNQVTTFIDS